MSGLHNCNVGPTAGTICFLQPSHLLLFRFLQKSTASLFYGSGLLIPNRSLESINGSKKHGNLSAFSRRSRLAESSWVPQKSKRGRVQFNTVGSDNLVAGLILTSKASAFANEVCLITSQEKRNMPKILLGLNAWLNWYCTGVRDCAVRFLLKTTIGRGINCKWLENDWRQKIVWSL